MESFPHREVWLMTSGQKIGFHMAGTHMTEWSTEVAEGG